MRPPTHDDPDAVPRNGTDVPWVDLDEQAPRPPASREQPEEDAARRDAPSRATADGRT